jgi:hypothetical protein
LGQGRTRAGWRLGGVLLAPVLAFGCAVMIVAMGDIGGTPTCDDPALDLGAQGECFSGSALQKAITLVLGWSGGAIAGLAALAALGFVITGRRGRLAAQLATLAVLMAALSILIGSL